MFDPVGDSSDGCGLVCGVGEFVVSAAGFGCCLSGEVGLFVALHPGLSAVCHEASCCVPVVVVDVPVGLASASEEHEPARDFELDVHGVFVAFDHAGEPFVVLLFEFVADGGGDGDVVGAVGVAVAFDGGQWAWVFGSFVRVVVRCGRGRRPTRIVVGCRRRCR